jgi:hypothetical protein
VDLRCRGKSWGALCDAGEKVMGLVLDAGKKITVKTLTFVIRKI